MDRNETIRISRLVAFGKLSINDISKLFMEYCTVDHNKSVEDTNKLISILLQNRILLSSYIEEALEYYEKKFTVCKLWSAPNPLNIQGQERKLLQIY